jgi:GIY-YIG catalytic domain
MPSYGEAPLGNPVLAQVKAERAGTYQFRLYPELWKSAELAEYYAGRKWHSYPFSEVVPDLPHGSGVYMFVVGPYCARLRDHSYIFYVGRTNDLKRRYREYIKEKLGREPTDRKAVVLLLNDFEGFLYFHFTEIPENECEQAEALLKDKLTPFSNTQLELKGKLTL